MTDDSGASGLRTIERALRALELVAEADPPLTVRSLAGRLEHNLSSTYNVVNTLVASHFLLKDEHGLLHIGPRAAGIGAAYDRDFSTRFQRYVQEVSRTTGETVYLTANERDRVVIRLVEDGSHPLRVAGLTVGFSGQEDRRASGKAVLAHLTPAAVAQTVARNHPGESAEALAKRVAELEPALAAVRRDGVAFDDEDFEPGIVCIAAPLFDRRGEVVGSIAASGAAIRKDDFRGAVRDAVVAAAAAMSRDLGAQP